MGENFQQREPFRRSGKPFPTAVINRMIIRRKGSNKPLAISSTNNLSNASKNYGAETGKAVRKIIRGGHSI